MRIAEHRRSTKQIKAEQCSIRAHRAEFNHPYRFDLLSVNIDSGWFACHRENVNDVATNREFSRLLDTHDTNMPTFDQPLDQLLAIKLLSRPQHTTRRLDVLVIR